MTEQQMMLKEIEQCRNQLHQLINDRIDAFVLRMTCGDLSMFLQDEITHARPLVSAAAQCKGMKPVAVILPGGVEVETSTWKKVAVAILRDCDSDPYRHEQLMAMRGRIAGNLRQLLAEKPDGMDAPLKITKGLYLESKFDTQALLDNLTQKILWRVGYDCGSVAVLYRDPQQEVVLAAVEQDRGITQSMELTM